jgi:homoserine dehydrogenase
MQTTRLAIVGLGNVGRRLVELIELKSALLRQRYDLELVVVGAVDTSGAAVASSPSGLDHATLLRLKRGKRVKRGIAAYPKLGRPGMTPLELLSIIEADVLVELSLTNIKDGEPGLSIIRAALARKMDVVTANKGPLVIAYQELAKTARDKGVRMLHSAAVAGGLPTVNIGARDLGASAIERFEGIVNGTTNYILSRMSEGQPYGEALKHAQDIGIAEADPSLDVDGWDAACKLVIVANAVLHRPTKLKDVHVEGIRKVTQDQLKEAEARRQVIKLVALAEQAGKDYRLSVGPTRLDKAHPLAGVGAGMMGILYHTDINGTIFATIEESDPYPTAAGVLRDIIQVSVDRANK